MIFLQLIYPASDASLIEIWEKNINNVRYFSINFEKYVNFGPIFFKSLNKIHIKSEKEYGAVMIKQMEFMASDVSAIGILKALF